MIKIEYLYPEVANLYGDTFNIRYLKQCLEENTEDFEIIETSLTDIPKFVSEDINMVYMGTMSESAQEISIKALLPYKTEIQKQIEKGTIFLLTGNSFEIFGKYIEDKEKGKINGLEIIDTYAKRDMFHRYNTLFLGTFKNQEKEIKIMGYKATFSFSFGDNKNNYVFSSIKGCGINKDSRLEGFRINNFIGTYLIGPLLVVNPEFTRYIIKLLGIEDAKLKFEQEAKVCYNQRLEEFEKESTNYLQ